MKRKQKRYETEEAIIKEIDHVKANIQSLLSRSINEDDCAASDARDIARLQEQLIKTTKQDQIDKIFQCISASRHSFDLHKEASVRMNKRRGSLEKARLPKLKNALAAFRTEIMSYTEDR